MADRGFPLEIVTPGRVLFTGSVSSLRAPGIEGDFEILAGHIPFLTALRTGILVTRESGSSMVFAISGGFIEVLRNQVTVIADTAERAVDIDVARAQQAELRARQHLESHDSSIDPIRAKAAHARSLNRLKAAAYVIG